MANVQTEHGFTRIADALLEALCAARMPGRHMAITLAVIRLTYGWGQTRAAIRSAQLVELTGVDSRSIRRVLLELERWGVIERSPEVPGTARTMGVVKDYETWRLPHREGTHAPGVDAPGHTRPPGMEAPGTPGTSAPPLIEKEQRASKQARARAVPFPADGLGEDELAALRRWSGEKQIPWTFVLSKADDIRDWAESKAITRVSWVATIRNAVKSDWRDQGNGPNRKRAAGGGGRSQTPIEDAVRDAASRRGLRPVG